MDEWAPSGRFASIEPLGICRDSRRAQQSMEWLVGARPTLRIRSQQACKEEYLRSLFLAKRQEERLSLTQSVYLRGQE